MMRANFRRYVVNIEVDLLLRKDSTVADNPDSIASAVRHYMRTVLPPKYTAGGYQFLKDGMHVEARERSEPGE